MPDIGWIGPPPPRALAALLRQHDIAWSAATDAITARVLVVHTRDADRVPSVASRTRPWIWIAAADVGEALALDAVVRGAYDVIPLSSPDSAGAILARIGELLLADPPVPHADGLITHSAAARAVVAQAARVAVTSMPVLLVGETGTGKEVLARTIHAWSPRRARQFVPINCAAIPNELMEAELFGYERGAFSGAVHRYDGQLMAAEGGTVFMDEIDDTPMNTQVKLLRVLEDRVVSRLGENAWHQVDFRIVAATNRDLPPLIQAGLFGSDLYERLAIVTLRLPPLRERLEDLPVLARHFIAKFAQEQPQTAAVRVRDLRADALRALQRYAWPGKIRELRNVLYETLVYKRAGEEIIPSDLPRRIVAPGRSADGHTAAGPPIVDAQMLSTRVAGGGFNLREEMARLQEAALREALARTGGNAAQAAKLLGEVGRGSSRDPGGTVRAMMKRLRIPSS